MALNNILVGAGFIGVGALLIVLGIRKNKRCSGVVVGKITGVHEDVTTDDDGFNSYSYSPEFEYEVNGKVYFGEITMTSQGGYMDFYTKEFLDKMGELTHLPIDIRS